MDNQGNLTQRANLLVNQLQFIAFSHIMAKIKQYIQTQDLPSSNQLLNDIEICINDIQLSNRQKSDIVLALVQPESLHNENGLLNILQNLASSPEFQLERYEQILRLCVQNQKAILLKWVLQQNSQQDISLLNALLVQAVLHNNAILFKTLIEHGAQWSIEHTTPANQSPLTCIELAILLDKPNIALYYFESGYLFPTLDKIVNVMFSEASPEAVSALKPQSCLLTTLHRLIVNQTEFLNTLENFAQHEKYLNENPNAIINPLRASYREQLILKIKKTGCYFHTQQALEEIIQSKSRTNTLAQWHTSDVAELFLEASKQNRTIQKP